MLSTFKDESTATAFLGAPIIAGVLKEEAATIVSASLGSSLEAGIQAAIATGGASSIIGASATSAGNATSVASAGGVAAKVGVGALAATVAAGALTGVILMNQGAKTPQPKHAVQVNSTSPASVELLLPKEATSTVIASNTSTEQAQSLQAPLEAEEKPAATPEQPSTPMPINTIADMIGSSDASALARYRSAPPSSQGSVFVGILARHGFRNAGQQKGEEATYFLYVLEKQNKRLIIIEKATTDGSSYGISYVFEEKANSLPELWELMFEY